MKVENKKNMQAFFMIIDGNKYKTNAKTGNYDDISASVDRKYAS